MNILNEYFDKIYCINLDRRSDRWAECVQIFKNLKLQVERFSACDGQLIETGFGKLYNGELGGTISHTKLIKKIKDENFDKVLILEDDVEFCNNFIPLIEETLNKLPEDWDIFFLGGNHTGGYSKINEKIGRVYKTFALHAYAVRNKCLDTIYENMIRFVGNTLCCNKQITPSVAADYYLSKLQPHLNCYSAFPNLAWQRESFSDLQQDIMNYDFLKQ